MQSAGSKPEFYGFTNWQQVIDFSATDEGESVRRFVTLVQANGTGRLWQAVLNATDNEAKADVVISTAHKAKGCEWDSVRIAEDFAACKSEDEQIPAAEVRLFYVAITRAKLNLSIDPNLLAAFVSGRMADLDKLKTARAPAERAVTAKPKPQTAPAIQCIAPMPPPVIKSAVTAAATPLPSGVRLIGTPEVIFAPRAAAASPPLAKPKGLLSRIMGW